MSFVHQSSSVFRKGTILKKIWQVIAPHFFLSSYVSSFFWPLQVSKIELRWQRRRRCRRRRRQRRCWCRRWRRWRRSMIFEGLERKKRNLWLFETFNSLIAWILFYCCCCWKTEATEDRRLEKLLKPLKENKLKIGDAANGWWQPHSEVPAGG